jgi:hypothetical protein
MAGPKTSKGLGKRAYLFPRTSTQPIGIVDYLLMQDRDVVINPERFTPEFLTWFARMKDKYLTS